MLSEATVKAQEWDNTKEKVFTGLVWIKTDPNFKNNDQKSIEVTIFTGMITAAPKLLLQEETKAKMAAVKPLHI